MLDDECFFPVLNRFDWQGRDVVFSRKLVNLESESADSLLVSYGVVTPERNKYLTKGFVREEGLKPAEIHKKALVNLLKRPSRPRWKSQDFDGIRALVRIGDDSTASDLLIRPLMRQTHEFLKARLLFVALPNRFCMFVTEDVHCAVGVAEGMYHDAVAGNGAPLTPLVFLLEDGRPGAEALRDVATMDVTADVPVPAAAADGKFLKEMVYGPWAAFILMARSDRNADRERILAFAREILKMSQGASPPVRKALRLAAKNAGRCVKAANSWAQPLAVLAAIRRKSRKTFAAKVRREYVRAVVRLAASAARDGGNVGQGGKVGPAARRVIEGIHAALVAKSD